MIKPHSMHLLLGTRRQQGWVMIEVVLCLGLFAVVLHLAQRQNEAHWQSIQLVEERLKIQENQHKQAAMTALTGSLSWLSDYENLLNQGSSNQEHSTLIIILWVR